MCSSAAKFATGPPMPNANVMMPMCSIDEYAKSRLTSLWRHKNSGKNLIWFMDGASVASSAMLAVRDSTWDVVGVSDIDLDGKADILWRNNLTGDNQAWFMDGVTVSDTAALATVPGSGWAVSLGTAP